MSQSIHQLNETFKLGVIFDYWLLIFSSCREAARKNILYYYLHFLIFHSFLTLCNLSSTLYSIETALKYHQFLIFNIYVYDL